MGRHDRHSRARRGTPARLAAGGLAVALAATLVQNQAGGATAQAVDFAALAGSVAADPVSAAAYAPAAYFLKLDTIAGESLDKDHRDAIEIESWSWGASNGVSLGSASGGAGAGKVSFSDLSLVAPFGAATPRLLKATGMGQHIPTAVLTGRKAGGTGDYLTITLKDVFVTGVQSSASGATPTDQITLAFVKITVSYRPQNPNGSLGAPVSAGWDLAAARPL